MSADGNSVTPAVGAPAEPSAAARPTNRSGENRLLLAVLAAGASQRLGQPKQLVVLDGEPLLRRQCRVALEADIGPVAVILGCRATDCAATIADLPIARHINQSWSDGLGMSIRRAADAAVAIDASGLLLLHVDQYRLTAADLRSLHAAWIESQGSIACVAVHGADFGPPVIFPRRCFADLLQLDGDSGARRVLAALPADELQRVVIPNAIHDLDLPAELAAAVALDRSGWQRGILVPSDSLSPPNGRKNH
jgi:molybdenum cofactor cytidylyltransferase